MKVHLCVVRCGARYSTLKEEVVNEFMFVDGLVHEVMGGGSVNGEEWSLVVCWLLSSSSL